MWLSVSVERNESSKNNNPTILMLNIVSMNLHMHNACIYPYISIVRDRDKEGSGGKTGRQRDGGRQTETHAMLKMK